MEKIKQAIAESKRSNATAKTNVTQQEQGEPIIENRPDNTVEQSTADIVYEKTKVVKLDPEHLAKNRIVSFNKHDHLSLGFDILRTQVIKKMQENGWRTMAITSPTQACGKSVISINLAMSIAHHTDTTTMLADFDLRRPSIKKYLGLASGPSLNDVLAGQATISEALVNPGLDRFVVLPTAKPVPHSSEVLSSQKVGDLIQEIRNRYNERIVIFDLPPMLVSDDAMIMLSQVDCVLVVVGNGMVSNDQLAETMRYIDPDKLLGTVLNKSESSRANEYYDY